MAKCLFSRIFSALVRCELLSSLGGCVQRPGRVGSPLLETMSAERKYVCGEKGPWAPGPGPGARGLPGHPGTQGSLGGPGAQHFWGPGPKDPRAPWGARGPMGPQGPQGPWEGPGAHGTFFRLSEV